MIFGKTLSRWDMGVDLLWGWLVLIATKRKRGERRFPFGNDDKGAKGSPMVSTVKLSRTWGTACLLVLPVWQVEAGDYANYFLGELRVLVPVL